MKRKGILLAALLTSGVLLATLLWQRWRPQILPAPSPDLTRMEKASREHITIVRQNSLRVAESFTAPRAEKAKMWGNLGEVYLAYGFSTAAAACLRNAALLSPDEFRWPYLYAQALNGDGQVARAAPAMADAVKAMEKDPRARGVDRVAALCFLGNAAIQLNRPADARQTLEAALELSPQEPFALFRLGQLASREGNRAEAIDYFQQALKKMPGRPEILNLLAAEYRKQGDLKRAAETAAPPDNLRTAEPILWPDPLRASVSERNQSGARQESVARDLLARGLWRSGAAHMALAVEADPGNPRKLATYAQVLLGLEQVDEARTHIAASRQLDPTSEDVRNLECLILSAAPATADQAIRAALNWRKEQPESVTALDSLAEVKFRTGHFREALEMWSEVGAKRPGATVWRLDRARALSALGRYADARRDLATALEAAPDDGRAKLDYARLLACSPSAGVRDGRLALRLSRELIAAEKTAVRLESLAAALAENGQFEEAALQIAEVLRISSAEALPMMTRRLNGELKAFQARTPWRERWPFEDRQ